MGTRVLTTEEFIIRARQVHGDRYDYSQVEYKNKSENVVIVCSIHGPFWQTPHNHVRQGSGCMECSGKNKPTTAEWVQSAQIVHGDKYDYSRVDYVNAHTKVLIGCPTHGFFEQKPSNHVDQRQGCRKCAGLAPLSISEWIERARGVHGDRFGYELVQYVNTSTKVSIRCPQHGYFEQTPKKHINGSGGCPKCIGRGLSTQEWVRKARLVHGDVYDYSRVDYVTSTEPVVIVCSEHGPFKQAPFTHVRGQSGCPKCVGYGLSNEEWINRAREVHGDAYDYSEFIYIGPFVKCRVICPEHGLFEQTTYNHIGNRAGCPLCAGSKGEKLVSRTLDGLGVSYCTQWSNSACRHRSRLLFDFFLPSFDALIEFDGIQHFEPVRWCESMTQKQAEAKLSEVQKRDRIKNEWAADNGYPLLRVNDLRTVESEVVSFVEPLRSVCQHELDNEKGELELR